MTDVYRTSDDRFADLPGYSFEPHYLEMPGDLQGLRMHFVDEGRGEPILLLHGEPTWAYLYRKMIPVLSESHRVIAPDFIGFGRSDKVTDPAWYTYERHVDSVASLVDGLDLEGVTIVVQDWGGPIGLRYAVENPERVARLVILNTGIFRPGPNWPSEGFLQWRNFAEQNRDLPVGMILQGATFTQLSDDVVAAYEAPFPTVESKAGAYAFPLIVPMSEDDPGTKEMIETGEALTRWEKPALVAFSDSDPIFPQRYGEKLAARIPGASFQPIAEASHFLQEDKGEEIATYIVKFLDLD